MEGPTVTRRRLIAAGTAAALGFGGLALGTDRAGAQADVTLGGVEVDPATIAPEDGEAYAPWLVLDGEMTWSLNTDPAEWDVYLLVGSGSGSTEAIGIASGTATARQGSGTYSVRGPITAASFWSPTDFSVAAGATPIGVEVPVRVTLVLKDAGGSPIVQASADGTANVTVEYGGAVAQLSASGTVLMQDDQDDPTPTISGGN